MSLSEIGNWICDLLRPRCASSSDGILKLFYKTICFFEQAICSHDVVSRTNLADKHNITQPTCNMSHYFNYLFENLSSPSCNVTISPLKCKNDNDKTYTIADYFEIWNKTSSDMFLPRKGEPCYLHWCDLSNYIDFWWKKLYENWCYASNCLNQHKMQFGTGLTRIEKGEPRYVKSIRRWLRHHFGIEWPNHAHFLYFLFGFFIFGCIYLYFRKVRSKKDVKPKSANREVTDRIQNLSNNYEILKEDVDNTKRETLKYTQELHNTLELHKQEIEQLKQRKLEKQSDLQQQATDLDQKCLEYQTQVYSLLSQIRDSKNVHQSEIEAYQVQNAKIQHQLSELRSQLDLTRRLHEDEILQLHKQIAELHNQNKEKHNKFKKQCQEYRKNLHDVQTRLQNTEEVCNQQRTIFATLHEAVSIGVPEKQNKKETVEEQVPYVVEALKKIDAIRKHTEELASKVDKFNGTKKDKIYKELNELLMRNVIKLDDVETEDHLIIRNKRKEALDYVDKCMKTLENKLCS